MNTYSIYDIVAKMIGKVEPVGSTHVDDERFDNLAELTALTNLLLTDIMQTAEYKSRHEHSMSKAGNSATKFLDYVKEDLDCWYERKTNS